MKWGERRGRARHKLITLLDNITAPVFFFHCLFFSPFCSNLYLCFFYCCFPSGSKLSKSAQISCCPSLLSLSCCSVVVTTLWAGAPCPFTLATSNEHVTPISEYLSTTITRVATACHLNIHLPHLLAVNEKWVHFMPKQILIHWPTFGHTRSPRHLQAGARVPYLTLSAKKVPSKKRAPTRQLLHTFAWTLTEAILWGCTFSHWSILLFFPRQCHVDAP